MSDKKISDTKLSVGNEVGGFGHHRFMERQDSLGVVTLEGL